jgi:hypothetical protein
MTPFLDGRAWLGKGNYYGTSFLVELFESKKHPGFYHYATYCADDTFCDESKRPMQASFLQGHLDLILKDHGLVSADLEWREVSAAELPLLGERAQTGD